MNVMHYSMKSHRRKNHQRWLNNFCRAVNQSICEDDLWLGRFIVEQKGTWMEWFEDGSGGIMYVHLQFRDKKTGRTKQWYTNCLHLDHQFWWELDKFIIVDCEVWSEDPSPYDNRIDFRGVK